MVQIIFNYSGVINGVDIQGSANMQTDSTTGSLSALANFNSFPDDFTPSLLGNSLLSISCSNGGKAIDGAQNILTLSNGEYTSIRQVEIYNSSNELLGNISINGFFRKVQSDLYSATVTLTGNYNGPTDIQFPNGYTLPLSPSNNNKLEGNFQKRLNVVSGGNLITQNSHIYYFNNGTTSDLQPVNFELSYDTENSYWLPDERMLNLEGSSIISPQ